MINHFRKTEPFTRGAGKYAFKKKVINEHEPKKEPAEIIIRITPIYHMPVPCLESKKRQSKNDQRINKKIQSPGAIAYCSHKAKVIICRSKG